MTILKSISAKCSKFCVDFIHGKLEYPQSKCCVIACSVVSVIVVVVIHHYETDIHSLHMDYMKLLQNLENVNDK